MGIRYVIRVCGNPWIRTGFYQEKIDSFPRRARRARRYDGARYHKTAQVEVSLVAIVMAINVLVGLDADRAWGGADPQLTTKRKGQTLSMFMRGKLVIEVQGLPPKLHRIKLYEFLQSA